MRVGEAGIDPETEAEGEEDETTGSETVSTASRLGSAASTAEEGSSEKARGLRDRLELVMGGLATDLGGMVSPDWLAARFMTHSCKLNFVPELSSMYLTIIILYNASNKNCKIVHRRRQKIG
jgi:hypothetical protein